MIEIRHLNEADADALWHLRATAFSRPTTVEQPMWVLDKSLGVFEDGKLQASVFAKPLFINWCGSFMPMYGVGGVSTLPLARRGGYIRKIFGEIERMARDEQVVLGMLYPFSYVYYRQFGYERISPRVSLSLPLASMNDFPRNSDGELYDGSQKDALLSLYNRYAFSTSLMTRRDDANDFSADPDVNLKYTYLHKGVDGFDAYATVQYTPESMVVTEIAYTSPEGLRGMLGMLRMFEGQRQTIVFSGLPQTSPILSLLSRYKVCQYTVSNGPMGRIYDTAAFLRSNSYPDAPGHFVLRVCDAGELCGGTYSIDYFKGAAEVRRVNNANPDIETDGANLSRILMSGAGYSVDEISFLPNTKIYDFTRAEDFSRAFPRRMIDHMAHY